MMSSAPHRRGRVAEGDIVSAEKRSSMMAAVGQRDTPQELAVRAILTELGLRYRIRNRDLPGAPDIANRSRKWAVFVHGCFWHGHKGCEKTKGGTSFRVPKKNAGFWRKKLEQNRARDARAVRELRRAGYRVAIVWECALRRPDEVRKRLDRLLRDRH